MRAWRMRKRIKEGVQLRDDEIDWLNRYDSKKTRGRGKKTIETPAKNQQTLIPGIDENSTSTPPPAKEETRLRSPPKVQRALSSPPMIHESQSWRKKHNGGAENGRELIATLFGDQWWRMLVAFEKQISDAGLEPIVEVSNQETRSMLILAVDDLLPSWVKATPAIIGAYKTTMLSTQRVLKAKVIKEAQENKMRAVRVIAQSSESAPVDTPKGEVNGGVSSSGKFVNTNFK